MTLYILHRVEKWHGSALYLAMRLDRIHLRFLELEPKVEMVLVYMDYTMMPVFHFLPRLLSQKIQTLRVATEKGAASAQNTQN